jgi:signal recognition particle subunit SRP54
MQRLGGMGGVLGMLPGVGKIKQQLDTAKLDDAILKRQQAIIGSMTRGERKNPKLLNASRKKRVASGSGTSVQDINKLVKMHRQMADMMKAMGKKRGLLGPPSGFPGLPPSGLPGLGGGLPRGLPGLPGMPRGLPGLPGSKKR